MTRSKYLAARAQYFTNLRSYVGLGEDCTLCQVVKALVDRKRYANAALLIFTAPVSQFSIYQGQEDNGLNRVLPALTSEENADLLVKLADSHKWTLAGEVKPEGLSIEFYQGEFITIPEEIMVELRKRLAKPLPSTILHKIV